MDRETGFQLGPWDVRPTHGTLNGPGGTIRLEPKVMDVLVCLAEGAGEVVTREQFIQRVWQGRVVTDEVLSRCISLLRTHLGDNSRAPQYIQTVPKIGYRMVTPILTRAQQSESPGATPTPRDATTDEPGLPMRRRVLLYGAAAVVAVALLALALLVLLRTDTGAPAGETSIVVLPFTNMSGDPSDEYFSDGLTEELIDRLSRAPGLKVVARTSAFSFKGSSEDVRAIARRLGVHYVLEGSVRKDGEQVRITAQLVEAARGFHLWSQRFDTRLDDIFTVQDEIANDIVTRVMPRFASREGSAEFSSSPPTRVMAAYDLLLRGKHHLARRDEAPIRRAMGLLEDAIALDPQFGEAYVELARAHALLPYYSYEDIEESFDLAVATVQRGAVRNPEVTQAAHDILAFIHFGRWEWIEAEEGMRKALLLQPHDPNIHQWYSQLQASVGRATRSLEHAEAARKLDVLSPVVNDRLAIAYLWVDQDERALAQFAVANELGLGRAANPEAYVVLLLRLEDYESARDMLLGLQKLFARASEWIDPFLAALENPAARPAAIAAVSRAAQERAISPQYLFGAWLYLGETDRALDVAFQLLGDRAAFDVEFLFAREARALRRNPRFGELVVALGLDRYWDRYGWPEACARKETAIACH